MVTNDREYRSFQVQAIGAGESDEMIVEGVAAVVGSPTVLFKDGATEYKEEIHAGAFDGAKMSDVVMNYDHQGKPVARTKNNTLQLTVDNTGLRVRADLSGTEEARRLYEEIKGGYIDKMSFAFVVSEDSYDRKTHTRHILGVERIFDVAATYRPAYDATSISARSYFTVEAGKELAEARTRELKKELIKMIWED